MHCWRRFRASSLSARAASNDALLAQVNDHCGNARLARATEISGQSKYV
jgi:hypothetical protein